MNYDHSLGPPPLIPRVTAMNQYPSLATLAHDLMLLPLSFLNLGTSSYSSLTREPTVSQSAVLSLARVIPTVTPLDQRHAQQFATSRLPKLTLPPFSGNPLDW